MSKSLNEFQQNQYKRFQEKLISVWAIEKNKLSKWESLLKQIHKRFLSFSCSSTVIGNKLKRNEYILSSVESGNSSIVLTLKGLQNPACVVLRQTIELILKHIYFLDHPVEYSWSVTRVDYKDLSFQTLLEYLRRTNQYKLLSKKQNTDISERLNYWYHILSRYVHVHSKDFLGYKTLSSDNGMKTLRKFNENTKELLPILTVIIIAFSPERYYKATALEQKLIKNTLPKTYKDMINSYLYEYQK